MRTATYYTIRYRLNGKWQLSKWKMPLDFAELQYDITQWEPLLETTEEIKVDDAAWAAKNSTSAFQRKTGDRPYADPKRPPILNWPYWPATYPSDEEWNALNEVWQRCTTKACFRR